jgi:hypothetical protein
MSKVGKREKRESKSFLGGNFLPELAEVKEGQRDVNFLSFLFAKQSKQPLCPQE